MTNTLTNTSTLFSQHWGVYGHDWAVEHLRKSLINGRARQAYLILGAESIGKETLARAFAMAVNCTQPNIAHRPCGECSACRRIASGNYSDVFYSQTDNNLIKIEEIRRMTAQTALKPFEGRMRVAIFRDFDLARGQSQDAMLKTLEEPAATSMIILIARSRDAILPTITSRSQLLHLRPVPVKVVKDALDEEYRRLTASGVEVPIPVARTDTYTDLLAALSGGRIGWALNALRDPSILDQRRAALDLLEHCVNTTRVGRFAVADDLAKDRSALPPLLDLWLSYWRDLLLITEHSPTPITNIDRRESLDRLAHQVDARGALGALRATQHMIGLLATNANVRLALEIMFLDYPGLNR